jgi:hypothetical protein
MIDADPSIPAGREDIPTIAFRALPGPAAKVSSPGVAGF